MSVDELRKLTSVGFKPFTLFLTDGRTFHVPHHDFIALSRRVVVITDEDGLVDLINPLHIVSAKPTQNSTPQPPVA